jgi:hypothetical protein
MYRCVCVWCSVSSEEKGSFPIDGMDTDCQSQRDLTKVSTE